MRFFITALLILLVADLMAQNKLIVPGYTGYAVPAEDDETTEMFSASKGLSNWTNISQSIQYFAVIQKAGTADIFLNVRSQSGAQLQISASNKIFDLYIPASKKFQPIHAGTITNNDIGVLQITITCKKKIGKSIVDIQSLEINTSNSDQLFFNTKERRNAASVHLMYPLPDTLKTIAFYNEVKVPTGSDVLHSYFMACGFARGYFGIQVNAPNERRVIFSVWDAGNEAVDRNKVADSNRVKLIAKGNDVIASDFGNEGTGGHSHWIYNWHADTTYKFLVTATPDSTTNTTTYAAYFYATELNAWKFIAAFRSPKDAAYLSHLYSFVEDFSGVNGQLYRKAFFGNQWVQDDETGNWSELTQATFSCDATGRAKDRIDFGGGAAGNQFYLWNGGFQQADAKFGDTLTRTANKERTPANLYHHLDSAAQAIKDEQIINDEISKGKIDTTGTVNGVYYKILKEGSGRNVLLTDTVTVFYKGTLLSGQMFDETKDEPATFPLNRLIKGWQYAVPLCKVGGTIRIIIPSGIAYSIRNRASTIPPNSILVFDVTVKDAKQ